LEKIKGLARDQIVKEDKDRINKIEKMRVYITEVKAEKDKHDLSEREHMYGDG
jgi:hypothetical protein